MLAILIMLILIPIVIVPPVGRPDSRRPRGGGGRPSSVLSSLFVTTTTTIIIITTIILLLLLIIIITSTARPSVARTPLQGPLTGPSYYYHYYHYYYHYYYHSSSSYYYYYHSSYSYYHYYSNFSHERGARSAARSCWPLRGARVHGSSQRGSKRGRLTYVYVGAMWDVARSSRSKNHKVDKLEGFPSAGRQAIYIYIYIGRQDGMYI